MGEFEGEKMNKPFHLLQKVWLEMSFLYGCQVSFVCNEWIQHKGRNGSNLIKDQTSQLYGTSALMGYLDIP